LTAAQAKEAKLETGLVQQRELANKIAITGKLTFSDLEVAHVFSPVTGRVTVINAGLGQRVKKGDSLAIIESPDLDLALANQQKADADLTAAKHNFDRQKELADAHAVSQRDFESAQDDYNKAVAELHRAQQMMKILHADGGSSGAFALRTPVAGEVISRTVNPGMEVQGQYGGGGSAVELFTVGELDPIWAIADVYEMDLSRVKVGDIVDVTVVAYPDRTFQGRVDWISGALDPVSRTAKLRCTLANPQRLLRPEMYATVSVAGTVPRLLSVPRTAVLHLGEQTLVFKDIGPSPSGLLRFEEVPVEVDEDIPGDFVRVAKGLAENDTIVTSGALLLTNQ
jgi:cobalt-zinc-cadmium efflux system membrane fusion protein